MQRSRILVATSILALALPATAFAEPGGGPADRFQKAPSQGRLDSDFKSAALDSRGRVSAIVELKADPVAVIEAKTGSDLSDAQKDSIKTQIKGEQDTVASQIKAKGGEVDSQMQSAYNGMRISVSREELPNILALPKVKGVHPVVTHQPTNSVAIPYLGVEQVWQNTGYTGKNVKVAIIDSGIDYTHATFQGPGTPEAFTNARSKADQPADPALFGPNAPRVKGGWDFVGDLYSGSATEPKPDPNPLDCGGHGTHVAGSAGGSGVTVDGRAYTGPYNAETAKKEWKIGPGVAPEADLYALKVFGCSGGTNVTTEAIDWAVDNGMQVINMSLGSPYGTAYDASAVAAANAAASGVVVVTSAGNSGPSPYLTGSPGTGSGVISVAANDPVKSFPGARLQLSSQTIETINVTDAEVRPEPYRVVLLKDDPATVENESLGCSAAAYTKAGIQPDSSPGQLAIVQRGNCARVAKAIYGQEAGAGAVLMVNNVDQFPPFEGPVTENPDTNKPFKLTIPFLGVKSSLGKALEQADGKNVNLSKFDLPNPTFSEHSSFTSSGPRSGDSGLKPSVTAPGVNVASSGIGTGNDKAILSGTSMASPMVAGVAALATQAHPQWKGQEISAALVNTANPTKVAGLKVSRGGGLVDPMAAVNASSLVLGDKYNTEKGASREATLSFGFAEITSQYDATKTLTIVNKGTKPVKYSLEPSPTASSVKSTVTLSKYSVTVPAGQSRDVSVRLKVNAKDVPGSFDNPQDQANFFEAAGHIKVTPTGGTTMNVPYLLAPRSVSNVTAKQSSEIDNGTQYLNMTVTNSSRIRSATADFFTWGIEDPKDVNTVTGDTGIDIRAVGVQSLPDGNGKDRLLVFAINVHDRFSSAAASEYSIRIDTNQDGIDDKVVFSSDSGQIRDRDSNGIAEVFIQDTRTGALSAAGYLSVAPTDSSTILLPVRTSDLEMNEATPVFSYRASVFSTRSDNFDTVTGSAKYNPWQKAISDGQSSSVGVKETVDEELSVDISQVAVQKPLGTMIVVHDNKAGQEEALTLPLPKP